MRLKWRAMMWGWCFSIPLGAIFIYLGSPSWSIGLVFAAGFFPAIFSNGRH